MSGKSSVLRSVVANLVEVSMPISLPERHGDRTYFPCVRAFGKTSMLNWVAALLALTFLAVSSSVILAADSDPADALKPANQITIEGEGLDILEAPIVGNDGEWIHNPIQSLLLSAQIHLKFGTVEYGNEAEFKRALNCLDEAEKLQAAVPGSKSETVTKSIGGIKKETLQIQRMASSTFFGRFPLVRGFGLWPESDELFQVRDFLQREAGYRWATFHALHQIAKAASPDRMHVLVLVPGKTTEQRTNSPFAEFINGQSRSAFAEAAGFTVHLGALNEELRPQPNWEAPDSAFDPFCRQLVRRIGPAQDNRSVMVVLTRAFTDEDRGLLWVQVQQRTYEADSLEKAKNKPDALEADAVEVFESLARDRSSYFPTLLSIIVGLYVSALVVHRGLSYFSNATYRGWQRWLIVPSAGFLIGFALTPLVMLALKRWMPDPLSSSDQAAWWPALAGALSLILPAGIFRLVAGTAGRYLPLLSCHSRWGNAFVPVAFGVCAGWTTPAVYALEYECVWFIPALVIAGSSIVYFFGRAVDVADEFPMAATPLAIGLSLIFGLGAFTGSVPILVVVPTIAFVAAAIHSSWLWYVRQHATASDPNLLIPDISSKAPKTVAQLRLALQSPKYLQARALKRFRASMEQKFTSQTRWIGVCGPAAAGKSKAAQFLIEEIETQKPESKTLSGHCVENGPPYHPFREAMAELGAAAGLLGTTSQMGEVNTIFERLADEFIPFWDFFSVEPDQESAETSHHDLIESVMSAIRKLTRRNNLILLIEDIQWIDEGSAMLLKHIREAFAPGSEDPLTMILTSRDAESFTDMGLDEAVYALEPATAGEQVYFLQSSLGIEQASAKHLVRALGVMSQDTRSIFWLIRAVGQLVEEDAFVPSPYGLKLQASYLKTNRLPVPEEMRAKLGASLRSSGQYRPVLECAALLGHKFRVDDVAQCLGMDRLLMLQILRHLELELQLVRDVPNDPDCYVFSSEFMLQIVREELGVVVVSSGNQGSSSKIARELHGRIAAVLERRTPRTPQLTYDLARHYHSAGPSYANKCVDFCLAASDVARRHYAFQAARMYIGMAEQSARLTRRMPEIVEKLRLLDRSSDQLVTSTS